MNFPSVRSIVYTLIGTAVLIATLAACFFIYSKNDSWTTKIANSTWVHHAVDSFGIQYHVGSLKLASERYPCALSVEVTDTDFVLVGREPVMFHVGRIGGCPFESVTIDGFRAGIRKEPNLIFVGATQVRLSTLKVEMDRLSINHTNVPVLTIEGAQLDGQSGETKTRKVEILPGMDSLDSLASVNGIVTGRLTFPNSKWLTIPEVSVQKTDIILRQDKNASWNVERLTSLQPALEETSTLARLSLESAHVALSRIRDLLRIAIICFTILIFLGKAIVSPAFKHRVFKVLLAAAPLVAPLVYLLLKDVVPNNRGVMVSIVVCIVMALVLRQTIYRKCSVWYQRWEPFAFDLSSCLVIVLLVLYTRMPVLPEMPETIKIEKLELKTVSAVVKNGEDANAEIGSLSDGKVSAGNLIVKPSLENGAVVDTSCDRLVLNAVVKSKLLAGEIAKFEFLPRDWLLQAPIVVQLTQTYAHLDWPTQVTLTTNVHANVPMLDSEFTVKGNAASLQIQDIRTIEGSRIGITAGHADMSWGDEISAHIQLNGIRAAYLTSQFHGESVNAAVRFSLSPAIEPTIRSELRGANLKIGNAFEARVGGIVSDFNQSQESKNTLRIRFDNVNVQDQYSKGGNPWLNAEFPVVMASLVGRSSVAGTPWIVHGETDFKILRSDARNGSPLRPALWLDKPIEFLADIHKGLLSMPNQSLKIGQTIAFQIPDSLPFQISFKGVLLSLVPGVRAWSRCKLRIPIRLPDEIPLKTDFSNLDAMVLAGLDQGILRTEATFESGWNRIDLPAMELNEVGSLNLESQGEISGLHFDDALRAANAISNESPILPQSVSFKIDGTWPPKRGLPALRIQNGDGKGMQIHGVAGDLQRVLIRNATLKELTLHSEFKGIETLDGTSHMETFSDLTIRPNHSAATTLVSSSDDRELLRLKVDSNSSRVSVSTLSEFSLGRVLSAFLPYAGRSQTRSNDIDLEARVSSLNAQLLRGPTPSCELALQLVPWRPLALDNSLRMPMIRLVSSKSVKNARIGMSLSLPTDPKMFPLELRIGTKGLDVIVEHAGTTGHVTLDLDASTHLTGGYEKESQSSELVERISTLASDFRGNLEKALDLFGGQPADGAADLTNVKWKGTLRNLSFSEPAVFVNSKAVDLRLRADVEELKWESSKQESPSTVRGTGEISTRLAVHGEGIMADGLLPMDFHVLLPPNTDQPVHMRVPFLLFLTGRLQRAPEESNLLWDEDYYSKFWNNYSAVYAHPPAVVLDRPLLTVGPLALRQVEGPTQPIRVIVGASEGLEIDVPFETRVLFGTVNGLAQANLRWLENNLALDSRILVNLSRIQSAAAGLAYQGLLIPLVDDQVDGRIQIRTDGVMLNHDTVKQLVSDPLGFGQFNRLGINAVLQSSTSDRSLRHFIQFTSATQVRIFNELQNYMGLPLQLSISPLKCSYEAMNLHFQMVDGIIDTKDPLLELTNLRIQSYRYDLGPGINFRFHLGSSPSEDTGSDLLLHDLLVALQRDLSL